MTTYNMIGTAMLVVPAAVLVIVFIVDIINECGAKNALKVLGCVFLVILWVVVAALLADGQLP